MGFLRSDGKNLRTTEWQLTVLWVCPENAGMEKLCVAPHAARGARKTYFITRCAPTRHRLFACPPRRWLLHTVVIGPAIPMSCLPRFTGPARAHHNFVGLSTILSIFFILPDQL